MQKGNANQLVPEWFFSYDKRRNRKFAKLDLVMFCH